MSAKGGAARRYLRRRRYGVLSTLSQRLDGYPFGSVVPFVLDHDARPVILVSRLAEQEADIVAHMNEDHARNLRDYCRHVHDKEVAAPRMIGIDCDGFDIGAGDEILRFDFAAPVIDASQARTALAKQCKPA